METEVSFSSIAPPVFNGVNFQYWAVRMEKYLEALDLWEAVEEDYEIPELTNNSTMAQIKAHKEKKTRKSKAKACLFAAVSSTIFTRIMSLKTAKEIWDYLKNEYEGDERIQGMQVLNLMRDFELQKMKKNESIKEYSDRLLDIASRISLLGSSLPESRIVQKILVTIPELYEATIASLENTKDMSKITLTEMLNALQAQEQRRAMRLEDEVEGALFIKHGKSHKTWKKSSHQVTTGNSSFGKNNTRNKKGPYPPCQYCKRRSHTHDKCWRRPEAKCNKCNQMGHEAVICRSKDQQNKEEAKFADQEYEDHLFVANCITNDNSSESWIIDSGCTNHMTNAKDLFKELRRTNSRVRIGNGEYLAVEGKGTVAILTCSGTKFI